jgi:protein-S-isoprenylcysteine O-methyltransferase Ste14
VTDRPLDPAPPPVGALPHAAQASAWIFYSLIVLEILFMVSPLAAYYYAIYAAPLNALAAAPRTAWLTQQMLPHFVASSSQLVIALQWVAWPLIVAGALVFLWGCVRIYHARLTGRGAVTGGLYRHIRHPQYVALAIVGLGTTLYWSRFIVLIGYLVMLWLYGALARLEERRCLARYGRDYTEYLERTGRFFPRAMESWFGRLARGLPRPTSAFARAAVRIALMLITLGVAVAGGHALRVHALQSLTVAPAGPHLVVFVAPMRDPDRAVVAALVQSTAGVAPRLVYVAPAHWNVPELGLAGEAREPPTSGRELTHPGSHGNSGGYERDRVRALIANPGPFTTGAAGLQMLAAAVRIAPETQLAIDLDAALVTAREPALPGPWHHVTVPAF